MHWPLFVNKSFQVKLILKAITNNPCHMKIVQDWSYPFYSDYPMCELLIVFTAAAAIALLSKIPEIHTCALGGW
jgi:hypothetical protein